MSVVEPVLVGWCPGCDRPYTAGEVTGMGILRPRAAVAGGPYVEFSCPRCDRTIRLVPHGQGRYAPPGQPPPAAVPPAGRVPPWFAGAAGKPEEEPAPPAPPPVTPRVPPREAPREDESPEEERPEPAREEPLTIVEALEILGVSPTADRHAIDAAFRERSLQCHPDKVAHLDEEFRALAERKFKRLRAAYDLVSGVS